MRTLTRLIHMWLLALAIAGNAYAATDKPNVIILLGDDVGYEAFGCTGNTYAPAARESPNSLGACWRTFPDGNFIDASFERTADQ